MSLIQFLSVGKSLVTVRSEPNRFQVGRQNLIPNLLPSTQATLVNPEARPNAPSFTKGASGETTSRDARKAGARASSPADFAIEAKVPSILPSAGSIEHGASGLAGASCTSKFLSRLLHPFSSRPLSEENPRQSRGGVRLEKVQVIRNDLTEVDLELISLPAGSQASRAGQKMENTVKGGGKVGHLSRFAAQLFEARQTRH